MTRDPITLCGIDPLALLLIAIGAAGWWWSGRR